MAIINGTAFNDNNTVQYNGTAFQLFPSLTGTNGNDTLDGKKGTDRMNGGNGNDIYYVDNIGDVVFETANNAAGGVDTVYSTVSFNSLGFGVENLTLIGSTNLNGTGNEKNNIINGNAGANVLNGGIGADTMNGSDGNDTYYVDNSGDVVFEAFNDSLSGIDTVYSKISFGALGFGIENLNLTGSANINGTGNDKNNIINGNSGANVLNGGIGADTMNGGTGNDAYYVDNNGDVIFDDDGIDTVYSKVSIGSLSFGVENLNFTGTANINGKGNENNNVINGNSGNNVLNGGSGADTLHGGSGNDTYYIDNNGDVVSEFVNNVLAGLDTVYSNVNVDALGFGIENLNLTGFGNIKGFGNSNNNVINGNSGANVLYGGNGTDTMNGGAGNDTYYVDNSGDVVSETTNNAVGGLDTVYSTVSVGALGFGIENLILTASASHGEGNANNNVLTGNVIENTLRGELGTDTLFGSGGNDTLYGGDDNDILQGGNGDDVINGGAGIDWGYYDTAVAGVKADLNLTTFQNTVSAGLDKFVSIENLLGSYYDDTLIADVANNILSGNFGNDTMFGNEGDDTLYGGYDDDVLRGGTGNDTVNGDAGDDVLRGGDGKDVISGGTGIDWSYYDTATVGVSINLGLTTFQNVASANDKLVSIENLWGSNYADKLIGNAAHNELNGGNGNDTLLSNEGNDTVNGGIGNDVINGGVGIDWCSYDTATAGVTVDLHLTTFQNTSSAGLDKLVSIENLSGSNYADTLIANTGNNVLNGGNGNDAMFGNEGNDTLYGGGSNDTLRGGSGNDSISGEAGNDVLRGGDGNDVIDGGTGINWNYYDTATAGVKVGLGLTGFQDTVGAGLDRLINIHNLFGSNYADTLIGNAKNNELSGGNADDILNGQVGDDTLTGGIGSDNLIGGKGADSYLLQESVASTDTLKIAAGDSIVSSFDVAEHFRLGVGAINTSVDRLDLTTTLIAANTAGVNGIDSGIIRSHSIDSGIIHFDDVNNYTAPLNITTANLADVFGYLKANITGNNTVAFVAGNNTFVFQDSGVNDTVVELLGVKADSVNTTGSGVGSVWLV